jgi:signal transduction histidine kinase
MHSLGSGGRRRIPIRVKLGASLAVPLIGLLAFSAVEVRQTANEVAHVRSEAELARSATGPTGVVTRLQDERIWASLALTGLENAYEVPMEGYEETRGATDDAIAAFREYVEDEGGAVDATYSDALTGLSDLEAIRQETDAYTGPRSLDSMPFSTDIYDRYAELITGLLDISATITPQVRDAELRQGTELTALASQMIELSANLARTTVVVAMQSPNGIDTADEVSGITMLLSAFIRNNQQIEGATDRYAPVVREFFPTQLAATLREKVSTAIDTGGIEELQSFIDETSPLPGEGYWALQAELFEELGDRADSLNDDATARQRLFYSLAAIALVVATSTTWLVSRSITGPLRSLTRQAKEMADHRLPEAVRSILETPPGQDVEVPNVPPVAVKTRDEVADVTDALNTVQGSALDLAVEQAVLRRNIADSFVNLGRRNQNLLGRQLDFITELESNETDPDTLGSLFRLDHLATRMRRNAESLLVLAGIDPPRKWAQPVRLGDVVRAALSEVEDFQRVRVSSIDPVTITGSAAADLAHLLAELLENALTFSSPDDQVTVRGGWGSREAYRIVVVDQGLGMPPSALDEANRRLAGSESFTVAPSKYLGHYVAGHLAARHGIRIRLDRAQMQGTVAVVDLPAGLLTSEDAAPAHTREDAAGLGRRQVPAGVGVGAATAMSTATAQPRPFTPTLPAGLPSGLPAAGPAIVTSAPAPDGTVAPPLPRRVGGTNLPPTRPIAVRRGPAPAPGSNGNGSGSAHRPSADDVYSFLSGFSDGVRRGLDDARRERGR